MRPDRIVGEVNRKYLDAFGINFVFFAASKVPAEPMISVVVFETMEDEDSSDHFGTEAEHGCTGVGGASLIAISPQVREKSAEIREKHRLSYPILGDAGALFIGYALAILAIATRTGEVPAD